MNLNRMGSFLLQCIRADSANELKHSVGTFLQDGGQAYWPLLLEPSFRVSLPIYLKARSFSVDLQLPRKLEKKLRFKALSNRERNRRFKDAVAELAGAFNRAGLNLIVLKGGSYLFTCYTDVPEARAMSDLDILVQRSDLVDAERVLRSIGYRDCYEDFLRRVAPVARRRFLERHHFHFAYAKDSILVELHWDLGVTCHASLVERCFASSCLIEAGPTALRILDPAATVFLVCYDFVRDELKRSLWRRDRTTSMQALGELAFFFLDLRTIVGGYADALSWREVLGYAALSGRKNQILACFGLARYVGGVDLPACMIEAIATRPTVSWYLQMSRRVQYHQLTRFLLLHHILAQRSRRALTAPGMRHYFHTMAG